MRALLVVLVGCSAPAAIGPADEPDSPATVHDAGTEAAVPEAGTPGDEVGPAPGPVVAMEPCSNSHTYEWPADSGAAYAVLYAEHAFPGLTAQRLASVQAIAHAIGAQAAWAPNGYASTTASAWVRDGAVAFVCGPESDPSYDSVTFVLP